MGEPMNSTDRVCNTILGKETDRQLIYGWLKENPGVEILAKIGSVEAFEDRFEFDIKACKRIIKTPG